MIEYLENNGFTTEQIRLLQSTFKAIGEKVPNEEVIDKIEFIYRTFSYTGISKDLINELISKNRSIILRKKEDIAVVAYVWNKTGLLSEIIGKTKGLKLDNIMSVFLRNLYLNSSIMQRQHKISSYALTTEETRFLRDYSPDYQKSHFVPTFSNLINVYGIGETYDEKKQNIEYRLDFYSKRWFLRETIKEREKRKMKKELKQAVDLYKYEKELWNKGYENIAGCDEAGRGPLFGPVVCASVILPHDFVLEGLNDSKKLTEKKREEYYPIIMEKALSVGVSIVSAKEIDEINIYEASRIGMIRATNSLNIKPDYIITDAMPLDGYIDIPHEKIIKGDAKSITIAAASVIAKVTRDRIMYDIDKKHPEYLFAKHKGYPTKKHIELLNKYGIIDGYRHTYGPVKEYLDKNQ